MLPSPLACPLYDQPTIPVGSYLLSIPHLHSLLSIFPASSLVQAIIHRDEQDCLAKNPFWELFLGPLNYAKQEGLHLNSASHRSHGFSSMKEELRFPTMPKAYQCWISKQHCKYLTSKLTLLCTKAQTLKKNFFH